MGSKRLWSWIHFFYFSTDNSGGRPLLVSNSDICLRQFSGTESVYRKK
ncbi:MAG: hypothetical protein ACTSPN_16360 [Promethearchaeota archaeon]